MTGPRRFSIASCDSRLADLTRDVSRLRAARASGRFSGPALAKLETQIREVESLIVEWRFRREAAK